MNSPKPHLLEHEMKRKIDEALAAVEAAGVLLTEVADSYEAMRFNRALKHEPCEKENQTKGFK